MQIRIEAEQKHSVPVDRNARTAILKNILTRKRSSNS